MVSRIRSLPPSRLAFWIATGLLLVFSPWSHVRAQISPDGTIQEERDHRQRMAVASAQVQVLQAQLALKRAQMQHEIHELEFQLQMKQAEILKAEAEFRLKQVQSVPRQEPGAAPENRNGKPER